MTVRILVIGQIMADDGHIEQLRRDEFAVTCISSLAHAVRDVVARQVDMALLFARDEGSLDHCAVLRALGDLPIAVAVQGLPGSFAARCLDAGADMAVMLPCASRELGARLRALARRVEAASEASGRRWQSGELAIDFDARVIRRRGAEVSLSPTEFNLLAVLAEQPGRVVTSLELLTRVWGPEYRDDVQYVRLYIGYLRAKLEDNPRQPTVILNHWGVGYRLATGEASEASGEAPQARAAALASA